MAAHAEGESVVQPHRQLSLRCSARPTGKCAWRQCLACESRRRRRSRNTRSRSSPGLTNGAVSATACAAIRNLEPQTLQRFADCVIATLTDPEQRECARRALSSLGELQPLTLAQHAPSVAAMLDDSEWRVRKQGRAIVALSKLHPPALKQSQRSACWRCSKTMMGDVRKAACE